MRKGTQASAHGRFQPLHKDHLAYLASAKEECAFLWVGITQPNIRELVDVPGDLPGDLHRRKPENNPLTFFERYRLIHTALTAHGVSDTEFAIIPFPIEKPPHLHDFVPPTIPIYTTICEEWNRAKIGLLEKQGYSVAALWEREEKKHEGVRIRKMMMDGNDEWKAEVPEATVELLRQFDLPQRLRRLVQA